MFCGCRLRLKCDGTRAETRFRLSTKRTSPFKSVGGVSLVDYWQASCAHQPAGFVLLVRACVLQSCDSYWLLTPFSCFPFTSPPVRQRVPSHFYWTLPRLTRRVPGFTLTHILPATLGVMFGIQELLLGVNTLVLICSYKCLFRNYRNCSSV
jgi:hypothetical protein